jgi:hypothetical protein
MGSIMKVFLAAVAATVIGITSVQAGGPVIVEDATEAVAEKPASSIGILPLLLIPIILCVALCGGDDEEEDEKKLAG